MDAQVFLSCDSLQLETLLGHRQTGEEQDTRPVGSDHRFTRFPALATDTGAGAHLRGAHWWPVWWGPSGLASAQ